MGYVEALRALWVLVFSERWEDLEQVGLCRTELEPHVRAFIQEIGGVSEPPTGLELLASVIQIPGFGEAADLLLKKYKAAKRRK